MYTSASSSVRVRCGGLRRVLNIFAVLVLVALLAAFANVVLHIKFHVCVWHFARLQPQDLIPIIYGYPTDAALAAAKRGEIALGGCVAGGFAALCPHCRWPAALLSDSPLDAPADTQVETHPAPFGQPHQDNLQPRNLTPSVQGTSP